MKFKNTSKIIRVRHESNFTQLSNEMLRDKNLTWKAKGLLACLMSLPDEWVILKTALHQFAKDGRDGTIAAFNELINNGYATQLKIRDDKGKFAKVDYIVTDIKRTDKPITDNPFSDKPISDNPHVINNVELNTLEIKNVGINNSSTSIPVYNTISEEQYSYLRNSILQSKF
jgi:hypothetical protein